jgi:hypothetical protein
MNDLPHGYTVTFSFADGAFQCVIDPHPPVRLKGQRMRRWLKAYQEARQDFFGDVATLFGISVAIVDETGLHVSKAATRQ